ncbi:MAG: metal-sulfur cluster assembly factor, partial [Anaerolineales bacterium]
MSNDQAVTEADVLKALSQVQDPVFEQDLVELDLVRDVKVEGDKVSLKVVLTTPAHPYWDDIETEVRQVLEALDGVESVD